MDSDKPTVKIGEILLQCGLVTEVELEEALAYAVSRQMRLGEALVELGFIDQNRLGWALSLQFDLSYVDVQTDMVDWELLATMPLERLGELHMVPLSRVANTVTAVIADPTMKGLFHVMAELFPHDNVIVQMATEEAIDATLMEARRRRRSAAMAAQEPEPESGGMDELFGVLTSGAAKRLLLVREGESDTVKVLHDGRVVGEESAEVLEALAERYSGMGSRDVRRDFTGLRPGTPSKQVPPIRVLHVPELNGSVTALAVVAPLPSELQASSPPVEFRHADLALAAAICLQEIGAFARETNCLAVALATRWDFTEPGVCQLETEGWLDGFRMAPLVVTCLGPKVMLFVEPLPDVAFGRANTPPGFVSVVLSGPRAEGDDESPDAETLRIAIRSILRGGHS